jgi:hypothetical protein
MCSTLCLFGHFGVKEISCPSRIIQPVAWSAYGLSCHTRELTQHGLELGLPQTRIRVAFSILRRVT